MNIHHKEKKKNPHQDNCLKAQSQDFCSVTYGKVSVMSLSRNVLLVFLRKFMFFFRIPRFERKSKKAGSGTEEYNSPVEIKF